MDATRRASALEGDGDPASACESGWDRRRRRVAGTIEEAALRLFADRGFRNVTVDDIAAATGVSARTVARYFPAKMDILLARPRRAIATTLAGLKGIDPSAGPIVRSLWSLWIDLSVRHRDELGQLVLWSRAAQTAPEVTALALGEQHLVLSEAYTALIASALGVDPATDLRAQVLAATVEAASRAVVEYWSGTGGGEDLERLFASAIDVLSHEFSAAGRPPRAAREAVAGAAGR